MYLNRKQKGYGWYTKVENKDNPNVKGYVNFSFKRGHEPINLNEYGSYEGELYFVGKDGGRRKVFPIVEEYNGNTYVSFKIMEAEYPQDNIVYHTVEHKEAVENIRTSDINGEDLPF